ncbi:MAG: hypothetical protein VX910_01205, partial [Candidatus Latescibacterota bacterium]|nr:hypothetical protein [Candidatus Latescibacterota bacterium]
MNDALTVIKSGKTPPRYVLADGSSKHPTMTHWSMGKAKMISKTRSVILLLTLCLITPATAEVDPQSGRFYFRDNNPFPDDTLGRIALYLIQQNQIEGNAFVSKSVRTGIVSYQMRFYDNGNKNLIDDEDFISVRRYTVDLA